LQSAFNADHGRTVRPYSNILVPVSESVEDLKNELLILKDSIRSIMRVVIKLTETNEFGQFLIKDEMIKTFFGDYFFIKKDGLIPGYIEEIEKMLRRIVTTDVYENMIREYYEQHKDVSESDARESVEIKFSQIKDFISYEYVKEMDYIDKKINKYYSLYSTRMLMVLSNNVNMQGYLNDLLMSLKGLESDEKIKAMDAVSKCFTLQSYKYVGRKSIERRKKRKPNVKSAPVVMSTLSDEERKIRTDEILHEHPDRYGIKQAADYFDNKIKTNDSFVPNNDTIKSKDDAMMVAAGVIYSGSPEFPYEVEFNEGLIETDIATFSNIRIQRKNK
jgi:hypothetical protein